MLAKILKTLLIFLFGGLGGIWAQASLLPYLAQFPFSQNIGFIKSLEEREVIINPTQTVVVQENTALTEAIERVEKTVAAVKTETASGKILRGAGLTVTSDGLIVTLAELVPQGSDFSFYIDGKWPSYQILKRDLNNNLALVKLGDGELSTAGFADIGKTKLGERVFLLGMKFQEEIFTSTATTTKNLPVAPELFANEGIISSFGDAYVRTSIVEPMASGSPLFNVSGNIVGISVTDEQGRVSAVPISAIRSFIGF